MMFLSKNQQYETARMRLAAAQLVSCCFESFWLPPTLYNDKE